jgi:hypothetical protein
MFIVIVDSDSFCTVTHTILKKIIQWYYVRIIFYQSYECCMKLKFIAFMVVLYFYTAVCKQ